MFDRKLWAHSFSYWPVWPCPSCGSIALARQKKSEGFISEETGPSKRAHSHDEWEPEWIEKKFVILLRCNNPACGDLVAVSGTVAVSRNGTYDEEGNFDDSFGDVYIPSNFDNAPPVFLIPKSVSDNVRSHLLASFSLIWLDHGAAANRFRAGVEALLDDQDIQRFSKTKAGKRERLTTHQRIEKLKLKHEEAASYLMAIKWLGNSGSHEGGTSLTREDLLNAAELFEAAIELLYLKKAEKFAKLAAAINKSKGKPKKWFTKKAAKKGK